MAASKGLGVTLITGGSGFIGSHIVQALLQEPNHGPIHVVSRAPKQLFPNGVHYHSLDLSNAAQVDSKLHEIQPTVIFHVASPRDTEQLSYAAYRQTNVTGTLNLLTSASRIPAISALVFTSSTGVIGGHPVIDADEDAPKCDAPGFSANSYHRTKVEAERLVLATDQSKLATVSLRICLAYGERDNQLLPSMMETFYEGNTKFQLGSNTAPYDFVYAGNAAKAHILAAKALLNSNSQSSPGRGNVKGEAFFITDGSPRLFWDCAHAAWRAAGDKTRYETDVTVIPAGLALMLAHVVVWVFWIFTLGRVAPAKFNPHSVLQATRQHTYRIDKARERLGYRPVEDFEGGFERAVKLFVEENGGKAKGV